MPLESATYISQLVAANPAGGDDYASADDHVRLIKAVLQAQFPNLATTAVQATAVELNKLAGVTAVPADLNLLAGQASAGVTSAQIGFLNGVTSGIQAQLNAKVPTSREIAAGNGLTGGGTLGANINLHVDPGAGISIIADKVALDTTSTRNTDHATTSINAGEGLSGGGAIDSDVPLAVDIPGSASISSAARTDELLIHNGSGIRRIDKQDFQKQVSRSIVSNGSLQTGDAFNILITNSASDFVVTIPPDSTLEFENGTVIYGLRAGTGEFTWEAGGGVSLFSPGSLFGHRIRFSQTYIRKWAANTWILGGDVG